MPKQRLYQLHHRLKDRDGFKEREALGYFTCENPSKSSILTRRGKWKTVKLNNLSKFEDDGQYLKLNVYLELRVRKERPMTISKILYTLAGGPLDFEALSFGLLRLYVNPALPKEHQRNPPVDEELRIVSAKEKESLIQKGTKVQQYWLYQ